MLTCRRSIHHNSQFLFTRTSLQIDCFLLTFQCLQLTFDIGNLWKREIGWICEISAGMCCVQTFFSCWGDRLSSTELKLCSDGELPFFSPNTIFWFGLLLWLFSTSLGGVNRGDALWLVFCLVGEFSLLLPDFDVKLKPSELLMGDIVRSGDNVMRCVIDLTGDVGESRFIDRARVSAINRRAWSRSLACRSSWRVNAHENVIK